MRASITLFIATSNVLEVGADEPLTDDQGRVIADAVVTAHLTLGGVDVAGETWPVTLAPVSSSPGVYRYVLPYTLTLVEDALYKLVWTADGGTGLHREWECGVAAVQGGCC